MRNLQCYSFSQIVTYTPSILFIFVLAGFFNYNLQKSYMLQVTTEGLASLAGFVNAMIFMFQGPLKGNITSKDLLNMDLSLDLTMA